MHNEHQHVFFCPPQHLLCVQRSSLSSTVALTHFPTNSTPTHEVIKIVLKLPETGGGGGGGEVGGRAKREGEGRVSRGQTARYVSTCNTFGDCSPGGCRKAAVEES